MTINYIGAFLLIFIGLAIIVLKKNLIKIVIGMGLAHSGINLLLISIGYRNGATTPIFTDGAAKFVEIPFHKLLPLHP